MANYITGTYLPRKPRADENLGLLANVMQMKQGLYDSNRAKIQQVLDAYGGIQLLRDEDREYLAAKLSSITTQVNNFGEGRDLSQAGVSDNIISSIRSVVQDPLVASAITVANQVNSFNSSTSKLREKKPELYSDINYQYALDSSGYFDYMSGKRNDIGNLTYTPYRDYNKRINDYIIDILGKQGDRTVETKVYDSNGNPTGEIQKVKIEGLSPDQLRNVAIAMLEPQDLKQVEIDGWYNNGGFDNPQILTDIKSKLTSRVNELDENILKYQVKMDSADNDKEKSEYKTELDNLGQQKSVIQKNMDTLSKSPKAASTFLEREKVIDNIVARFSPLYTQSESFSKDDVYWARLNYQLELAKEERLSKEATKKSGAGAGDVTVVSSGTGELKDLDSAEKVIENQISTISDRLDKRLLQYRDQLEIEASKGNPIAKKQMELLTKKLQNKKSTDSELDVLKQFISETDTTNDPLVLTDENGDYLLSEIRKLYDDFNLYNSGYEQAKSKAKSQHVDETLNSDKVFKAFFDNKDTTMLWNGKAIPVYKLLQQKGLMDSQGNKIKSIRGEADIMDALMKSYYASDVLNNLEQPGAGFTNTLINSNSLKELKKIFGEQSKEVVKEGQDVSGLGYAEMTLDPNTRTGQFLLQARQNGIYDRFSFFDQDLSSDDATVGEFLSQDYRDQESYKNDLEKFRGKLANQQQIGITYSEDKDLFNSLVGVAQVKNGGFIRNQNSAVNVVKEGEEIVIRNERPLYKNELQGFSESRLSMDEFRRNFPELSQRLEFVSEAAIYTYDRLQGKPLISAPVKFIGNSSTKLYSYASKRLLANQPQFVKYLTKDDSKTSLKKENMFLARNLPQFSDVVDMAIDESPNYSVNIGMTAEFGEPVMHLSLIDIDNKETLHSISMEGISEVDNFKYVLDDAPQVYYSILLDDIFKKQAQSIGTGSYHSSYTRLIKSLNQK